MLSVKAKEKRKTCDQCKGRHDINTFLSAEKQQFPITDRKIDITDNDVSCIRMHAFPYQKVVHFFYSLY